MDTQFLKEINLNVRYVNYLLGCNNSNHKLPWRRLYDYEVLFITEGEIIVETNTRKYVVGKNQLHIMPPFTYHTRYFADNAECNYFSTHIDFFYNPSDSDFSVNEVYIKPIWDNEHTLIENTMLLKRKRFESIKVPSTMNINNTNALKTRFKVLLHAWHLKEDKYKLINLKAKAYELLLQILKECDLNGIPLFTYNKNLHDEIIIDFIQLVQEEYMNEIDLRQIATCYGLSKNHFSKIFKKAQNIAPHDYIIAFRLDKAKALLKSGKYYVNEVADMVGYKNFAYFSRLFKLKEGVSPTTYLKKINSNLPKV